MADQNSGFTSDYDWIKKMESWGFSIEDPVALRDQYHVAVDIIKLLSDIRFRCLVFVTAITAVANALVPKAANPEMKPVLGVFGFLVTLGITIYELRNSQLYEAAMHRAKELECRLGMKSTTGRTGGLFSERPPYVKKSQSESRPLMTFWFVQVKHDRGLAFIYGPALGAWAFLAIHGLLSLPAPTYAFWLTLSTGWILLVSGIVGFVVGVGSILHFNYHDENRLSVPKNLSPTTSSTRFGRLLRRSLHQVKRCGRPQTVKLLIQDAGLSPNDAWDIYLQQVRGLKAQKSALDQARNKKLDQFFGQAAAELPDVLEKAAFELYTKNPEFQRFYRQTKTALENYQSNPIIQSLLNAALKRECPQPFQDMFQDIEQDYAERIAAINREIAALG